MLNKKVSSRSDVYNTMYQTLCTFCNEILFRNNKFDYLHIYITTVKMNTKDDTLTRFFW